MGHFADLVVKWLGRRRYDCTYVRKLHAADVECVVLLVYWCWIRHSVVGSRRVLKVWLGNFGCWKCNRCGVVLLVGGIGRRVVVCFSVWAW